MASTSASLPAFTLGESFWGTGWLAAWVLAVDCVCGAVGAFVVGGVGSPVGAGDCWPCGGAGCGVCWVCAVATAGMMMRDAARRVAIHWDANDRFIGASGRNQDRVYTRPHGFIRLSPRMARLRVWLSGS